MTTPGTTPWFRAMRAQTRLLLNDGRAAAPTAALGLSVLIAHLPAVQLNGEELGLLSPLPILIRVYVIWLPLVVAWASLVWRGERPGQRDDLHSVPLSHAAQDIARVAAGAFWLMVALLVAALSAFALGDGSVFVNATTWVVAAFVGGSLLTYGLVSALALVVRWPALVTIGALVANEGVQYIATTVRADALAELASRGPLGLFNALIAALEPEIHGDHVTAIHGQGQWLAWICGWLAVSTLALCAPGIRDGMLRARFHRETFTN